MGHVPTLALALVLLLTFCVNGPLGFVPTERMQLQHRQKMSTIVSIGAIHIHRWQT